MKPQWIRLTLGFSLFCISAASLQAARAPLLRHQPTVNQTNVYSVEISVRGETGTDILFGNVIATTKPDSPGVITLALQGTLNPKREMPPRPIYGSPYSYPRWTTPIRLAEAEIQFDERGRLLRTTGDPALPIPLGTVAQLFVEPFPEKASSRWETVSELAVMGDPLNLGPTIGFTSGPGPYSYGYSPSYPGSRGGPALVNVTCRAKYEITTNAADRITIAKRVAIESALLSGQEPSMLATGEGQFEIDPATGLLLSASFDSTATSNSETVTRRATTALQLRLLRGAERETALHPPVQPSTARPVTKPLTEEELAKLFEALQSDDYGERNSAVSKLYSAKLEKLPPGMLEFMAEKVDTSDSTLKNLATRIIADYGTADQVPVLLRMLKSDDYSDRQTALRGLGRLQEKSAAEPIADLLAAGDTDATSAREALIKIGPPAEEAVLALLKERHSETRRSACQILKQIGTGKSLEALQALMLSPNRNVREAAGEAARAIIARTDP